MKNKNTIKFLTDIDNNEVIAVFPTTQEKGYIKGFNTTDKYFYTTTEAVNKWYRPSTDTEKVYIETELKKRGVL